MNQFVEKVIDKILDGRENKFFGEGKYISINENTGLLRIKPDKIFEELELQNYIVNEISTGKIGLNLSKILEKFEDASGWEVGKLEDD